VHRGRFGRSGVVFREDRSKQCQDCNVIVKKIQDAINKSFKISRRVRNLMLLRS